MRVAENASHSESDPCLDASTTDDQLRCGGVVRRLSVDDVTVRDEWRIIDDVEDAEERWNAVAGSDRNDTRVVVSAGAGEVVSRRRDRAPEMTQAFGSDDGDRLHDDTDNDDNADDDSNAPGDDSDVHVAMMAGPAAARWLFPAAVNAQPLGARMLRNLPGAAAPQPSAIGRDSNVKLAAMENTDVAVAQFAENNILPADVAALNVVLWNLHQQQMFQMHLILQLQQQIIFATAAGGAAGGVVGGLVGATTTVEPQRDATLPDVLPNNKPDDSSAVLNPAPAPSAAATGFRDSLYKPLVPCDTAATALDKNTDIASSTTIVDGVSGPRPETRSPVTYVSAPSITSIPPMLAMMDMSLGRLEPPAKEGMILPTSVLTAVFPIEPELAGSSSVFFFHLFHERTFGTGCFYRPDVLPVTQPTVSNHWRKHKELTPISGLASSFLHATWVTSERTACYLEADRPRFELATFWIASERSTVKPHSAT